MKHWILIFSSASTGEIYSPVPRHNLTGLLTECGLVEIASSVPLTVLNFIS